LESDFSRAEREGLGVGGAVVKKRGSRHRGRFRGRRDKGVTLQWRKLGEAEV
jgi:hypothetical protein